MRKLASCTAGLFRLSWEHMRSISAARATMSRTSRPHRAAGTRPKTDSAEKRPPTVGSPRNTPRKERSRASLSRSLPGSVMATKCLPASCSPSSRTTSSQMTWYSESVSSVPPDLLDTMNMACA